VVGGGGMLFVLYSSTGLSHVCTLLLDIAKQSFYRPANAIFGKVGRHASEEVILQLVSSKCVPALLYGLEACPLNKTSANSLDFVIDRFFSETV